MICMWIHKKNLIKRVGIIAGLAGVLLFFISCTKAILEAVQNSHNIIDIVGLVIGGLLIAGYIILHIRNYIDDYGHSIRVSSSGTNNYTKEGRPILKFLLHLVNKIRKLW